ncbi:helix-turn-helix domain-containing protein [Photobacterium damselae]|uniref:helix-turn-helix domain-containing protein n=1 Tax=Photobacterium damselae TaxID=38293 RepID=UPI0040687F4E
MTIGNRLKAIIKEERISQRRFAEEMALTVTTIENYISERRTPSGEFFLQIGNHPVFSKYTMWLLTGHVEPNSGQVSPAFSTQERCGLTTGKDNIQKKA